MDRYPELIEPLLFYILHRANAFIYSPEAVTTFKAFFIDEAWRFFGHPTIRNYIVEALKTWRKKNAAMILSTQSLDELDKSEIVNIVIESCATKIFLANPDMDRELYRNTFHLNDNEIEMISARVPKRQGLVKRPDLAKVVNLEVDEKSYWLSIEDLPSAPYKATVDFYEIAYWPADHVENKRTLYTAHFVFLFRDSVPNDLIQVNPLGLAVTYFREDEAFK